MFITQLHQSHSTQNPFLLHSHKAFIDGNSNGKGNGNASRTISVHHSFPKKAKYAGVRSMASNIKAVASTTDDEEASSVKAIVTVKPTIGGLLSNLGIDRGLDDIKDLLGETLVLELVSTELDPNTGFEKDTIKGYAHRTSQEEAEVKYESNFEVPIDFGPIGAVFVENEHHKEMYLQDIILNGCPNGPVRVNCNSWVHSKYDNPQKRVFFAHKQSYLPSQTPRGLRKLREEELWILQGSGQGERRSFERVYDYDTYNDLGDPDTSVDLKRPVLGGKEHPYPRRCRTGRPPCDTDPLSEKRGSNIYIPRDEAFSEAKQVAFSAKTVRSALHIVIPTLETVIIDGDLGFPNFTAVDSLFNEGVKLPSLKNENKGFLKTLLPRLVKAITNTTDDVLRFEAPETMDRDKFFWFKDEEFARQTLAGVNPHTIKLVTEWPLKSKLDPKIYGLQDSAITTELVEREMRGLMTVKEAISQKKLFIIDYHDLFLPYVSKVRQIEGTTLYGSRTLLFLTPDETLWPLAIELTRPPMDGKPQWKQVFTPCWDSTSVWLWRLAKAHVLAHESSYHQLVSHWLRTHCATEPYIIATNRQLSEMHPIYRLLHPHFRYTMDINALAREILINGGGIFEKSFTPGKYSMELSSFAYDQEWQFNLQALPADLISRGMAAEDPTAPHGLKLTIEDYPYANDGLLLWDSMKEWVSDYVNHYYPNPNLIESDQELQAWWIEIRTVGHGDKKDEPWWPVLKTPKDLIEIITTIVWVTSGHHAAVNFGQYTYTGYFPNRPTIARTNMPTEDPSKETWKTFLKKPEGALLQCFPSQMQATKIMAVMDILSSHSSEEEYIGEKIEPTWAENPVIKAAFERFNGRLMELEGTIDERNANKDLKNRNGAGVVPYELLKPFSPPGVTGKGVPYSISV
ncbi:linoleate 13S-lipoxygenase 2-1, chloroplastic-like isoform X1 [Quercus lobata]|uniref:linoleate 13S-lipoxygenase 2-1, chloroplastic-like isoform X1 n=1 Tax=Quercus lobata TaxID=97700 RepID=UPI001244C507|nr:linoleate 13S-lipoxygenase 2-1, chloroplastic-like isoform X1 [Quercus lobata]